MNRKIIFVDKCRATRLRGLRGQTVSIFVVGGRQLRDEAGHALDRLNGLQVTALALVHLQNVLERLSMDKLRLTGRNLGRVFNSRGGYVCVPCS
jgi:hypothetical protein